MKATSFISQLGPGRFYLTVHAKPGGRSSSLACQPAVTYAALEVRIGAPPAEGKANAELIDFMQTIIEKELARLRTVQHHTPRDGIASVVECSNAGPSKKNRNKGKIKDKKKNPENNKMECAVELPDKVRVSLVGGATARYKTLEVSFPGTQEELISVLNSAYVS
ncbi:uncharacterized protein Tco025E_02373 [Trypanosoma conorhini]|uniref:Uncharacterized protein n=1 Tax=Trypanosoma conorhini TaxID=83891 RepID=A0A3R7N363_9TRYP|nr:uncharacterized protein Tco025E_02373 [Trypanosoma conorhini]RNF24693.1 hypothetical protein Tco025E_02373 [Trypanosoma conorhini]